MYIYNVTIQIEDSVHDQWLKWLKEEHIPDMLATGKFSQARICKLVSAESIGGITYAVQYHTPDMATLEQYYQEDADRLRRESLEKFPDKFVAFRTELEVISEHGV